VSAPAQGQRVRFRFGLTGRRWGVIGPVVLLLQAQEAPARFDHLIEPLLASGRQVVALDDPTHPAAARAARIDEFAAAITEAAVEIEQLEAVFSDGLGSAAAARALEQGLFVDHAVLT
jgi:alpha-beta hydrolase superfamily lysophospholipase